jgi:hypothetical protein
MSTYTYSGVTVEGRDIPGAAINARTEGVAWTRAVLDMVKYCAACKTRLETARVILTKEDS